VKLASFEAIIHALHGADVRYLITGGLAVCAHGCLRSTHESAMTESGKLSIPPIGPEIPSPAMTNFMHGEPTPLDAENILRLSWTHWIERRQVAGACAPACGRRGVWRRSRAASRKGDSGRRPGKYRGQAETTRFRESERMMEVRA